MKFVIDTNVLIVAAGRAADPHLQAQLKAAQFLREIMRSGTMLEDEEDLALTEYKHHFDFSGQPTFADEFFAWYARTRWTGSGVVRVRSPEGGSILDLLPKSLAKFDPSDHKWVCIYIGGAADYIVNAVDSDWREAREWLEREGIRVLELLE